MNSEQEIRHCEICDKPFPEDEMHIAEEPITWNQFYLCGECFKQGVKEKAIQLAE